MLPVTTVHVHFETCGLDHLERSLFSLSRQTTKPWEYGPVYILNNSRASVGAIRCVASQLIPDHSYVVVRAREGWTHPHTVNEAARLATGRWLFFTRSDYLLMDWAFQHLILRAERVEGPVFLSGCCRQTAYDRDERPYPLPDWDALRPWRDHGAAWLIDQMPGYDFSETDQDAGVWLTRADYITHVGGANEQLASWGYAQSTLQRVLRAHGVWMWAFGEHIFLHQSHGEGQWVRDHARAREEYEQFGRGQ